MSKISSLYNILNCHLVPLGIFYELLSLDESMAPYFERQSAKMFIRGKSISLGYKICDGYPYQIQIYQGKQPKAIDQPLGTRVVNSVVSITSGNSNVLPY